TKITTVDVFVDDVKGAIITHNADALVLADGRTLDVDVIMVMRVADGVIRSVVEFMDLRPVETAFGASLYRAAIAPRRRTARARLARARGRASGSHRRRPQPRAGRARTRPIRRPAARSPRTSRCLPRTRTTAVPGPRAARRRASLRQVPRRRRCRT